MTNDRELFYRDLGFQPFDRAHASFLSITVTTRRIVLAEPRRAKPRTIVENWLEADLWCGRGFGWHFEGRHFFRRWIHEGFPPAARNGL